MKDACAFALLALSFTPGPPGTASTMHQIHGNSSFLNGRSHPLETSSPDIRSLRPLLSRWSPAPLVFAKAAKMGSDLGHGFRDCCERRFLSSLRITRSENSRPRARSYASSFFFKESKQKRRAKTIERWYGAYLCIGPIIANSPCWAVYTKVRTVPSANCAADPFSGSMGAVRVTSTSARS